MLDGQQMEGMDNGPSEMPAEMQNAQSAPPMDQDHRTQNQSDDLDLRIQQEREFFRQKKLLAQKERELEEKERSLSKPKDLDSLIDDILGSNPKQDQEEKKPMTHEEIIAEAKKQIREEFEQESQEHTQQQQEEENYNNFVEDVGGFLDEMQESFPLAHSMGVGYRIAEDVMAELESLSEEYGEEYAEKWYNELNWDEVAQAYENDLAENFKAMLQSPRVRQVLSSYLGDRDQMPRGESPRTLSQDDLGSRSQGGLESMSEEERVAYIKDQLRKKRLQEV